MAQYLEVGKKTHPLPLSKGEKGGVCLMSFVVVYFGDLSFYDPRNLYYRALVNLDKEHFAIAL